tara:strand:+ start:3825 stop:4325 length:501 start_codon:yes stop_codon:yes gene_type:complete
MNVQIRVHQNLYEEAFRDLRRPHPFAYERVGFLSSSTVQIDPEHVLVLLTDFHSIPDDHYLENPDVGACIGTEAIRAAMQRSIALQAGQIHTHIHEHWGQPHPSSDDLEGVPPINRSLSLTSPNQTSGYLILSHNSAWAELNVAKSGLITRADKFTVVGFPLRFLQ